MIDRFSLVIQWSEADQVFMAILPEFDDALTHGETYEKAARQGRLLIESMIMWHEQDGKPLPQPLTYDLERGRAPLPERLLPVG